jgi:hypothetical protein
MVKKISKKRSKIRKVSEKKSSIKPKVGNSSLSKTSNDLKKNVSVEDSKSLANDSKGIDAKKQSLVSRLRNRDKVKIVRPKLSSGLALMKKSLQILKTNWKLFGGITLIYALLTLILVRGFGNSGTDIPRLKELFDELYQGQFAGPATTASLFASLLLSGSNVQTPAGSVYQSILLIIISLATIWSLRQVILNKKIQIKDAFYKGLYPLVPLILVLLVIGLQLVPLAVGSWLYGVVIGGGIAGSYIELGAWLTLIFGLFTLTLYMISSSLFALCIVTLPDMTPIRAIRSARQLVVQRRWTVMRKVLFLPFSLLLLAAIFMLPIILFLPAIAEMTFFILSLFGWILAMTYIYSLYRELLDE